MKLKERRVGKEGAKERRSVASDGVCDDGGIGSRGAGYGARTRPLPKWMEKLPGKRRGGRNGSGYRGDRGKVG